MLRVARAAPGEMLAPGARPGAAARACRRAGAPSAPPRAAAASYRGRRRGRAAPAAVAGEKADAPAAPPSAGARDARQLLGIKGAAATTDKWALRLQARRSLTVVTALRRHNEG